MADVPGAARRAAARDAADDQPLRRPRALARWRVPSAAGTTVLVLAVALAVVLGVRAAGSGSEVSEVSEVGDVVRSGADAGADHGVADPGSPPTGAAVTGTGEQAVATGPTAGQTAAPQGGQPVVVHVVGRVRRPGTVRLTLGSRVEDALRAAGGAAGGADLAALNLARPLQDGEQVLVPRPGELPSCGPAPVTRPGGATGPGPGPGAGSLVDLNSADSNALDELPGIGPVLAERIIAWRTEHGRFSSVDELGEVSGIGESLLSRLRPLVRV